MISLKGSGVSGGIAIGKLHFPKERVIDFPLQPAENIDKEISRFESSRALAVAQLGELAVKTANTLGKQNSLLFEIHQMMLEDLDYCDTVKDTIREEKVCAEYAVSKTAQQFATMFSDMEDEYMRERAADVKDVSIRVIEILTGRQSEQETLGEPCIYCGLDFTPSETAQFDRDMAIALVTSYGSKNSHTAIFARTLGIPAVIGLKDNLTQELDGKMAILDGVTGELYIEPDDKTIAIFKEKRLEGAINAKRLDGYRGKKTITKGGKLIKLYANIGSPADVEAVLQNDAEGIGLFRSEFLYLESDDFPSEETQYNAYRKVAEGMQNCPVIIRTLDIGADKQAAYFNLPLEENPAMGMRAIRICLTMKEVFKTQLRALYRASAHGNISIMLPMITSLGEVKQAKAIIKEVKTELLAEGHKIDEYLPVGIMIETPAAAIISDLLAREVDFFSIGTNDLIQYTLAADRQNESIASFCDDHHEAVKRLIKMTCSSAHKQGIWVGVCGELAADKEMTEFFVSVEVDELSVTPSQVLSLREKISRS